MKKIVLIMLIVVLTIICFGACAKPEPDYWTVDVGAFYQDGNELLVDLIVREVGLKEKNAFTYPKQTMIFADLFYGYNKVMEKDAFLKDSQLPNLGKYTIRYLRFFTEFGKDGTAKTINLRVDLKIDGKTVLQGDMQELAIQ